MVTLSPRVWFTSSSSRCLHLLRWTVLESAPAPSSPGKELSVASSGAVAAGPQPKLSRAAPAQPAQLQPRCWWSPLWPSIPAPHHELPDDYRALHLHQYLPTSSSAFCNDSGFTELLRCKRRQNHYCSGMLHWKYAGGDLWWVPTRRNVS